MHFHKIYVSLQHIHQFKANNYETATSNIFLATLVSVCTQLSQRLQGKQLILLTFLTSHILLEFQQGICHNTSSTGVLRSATFHPTRIIHIPERNEIIARFLQSLDIDVGHFLSEVQEYPVVRIAINHRIAVDGPALSSYPHRMVSIALMGHTFDEIAIDGIIYCHMIAAALRTASSLVF